MYTADFQLFIHYYLESLSEEGLHCFPETYLGGDTATGAARTVFIPIHLPNSYYLGRAGDSKVHGIFPCYTGTSRLELPLTMNPAEYCSVDPAQVPTSIAGEFHDVPPG